MRNSFERQSVRLLCYIGDIPCTDPNSSPKDYNGALHTGSAQGSAQKILSWAWAEPSEWTRFSSDFQCRLGISDLSCRMFTLWLGSGSAWNPSRAPSRASVKCPNEILKKKNWSVYHKMPHKCLTVLASKKETLLPVLHQKTARGWPWGSLYFAK